MWQWIEHQEDKLLQSGLFENKVEPGFLFYKNASARIPKAQSSRPWGCFHSVLIAWYFCKMKVRWKLDWRTPGPTSFTKYVIFFRIALLTWQARKLAKKWNLHSGLVLTTGCPKKFLSLIWRKLPMTVFTRSVFTFSEAWYFNLKFGIK